MRRLIWLAALGLACNGDKGETGDTGGDADADADTDGDTDTVTGDCGAYEDSDLCTAWVMSSGTSPLVDAGSATDVTGLSVVSDGGVEFMQVSTEGLPSYDVTLTQADIDDLDARPNASTDFVSGQTTATAGTTYQWGADIGFYSFSAGDQCGEGAGYGWWPPGPECPSAQGKSLQIPVSPVEASGGDVCETGAGAGGYWVNGVSIYNWGDTFAYDSDGVWLNVAPAQEVYDLGVCGGHAAGGDYHHHSYSQCLADVVGDAGSGHSPIYGFAADGYPIHGPWYAGGTEAQSCWTLRDYDDAADPTGCGGTGERSCVMVDPWDPAQGTETASSPGPTTSETVTSLSGNTFPGTMGLYFADYWYDGQCAAEGGAALDEHNGHEHDGLGYHYHVTFDFPYTMGPTLKGVVYDASVNCNGISAGGGPPP
jgi:hypothetical protein